MRKLRQLKQAVLDTYFEIEYCKIIDSFNYCSTVIQKNWRGYKARKAIKNIYSKLPCDMQQKIKHMISREYYIKKYNDSVIKVVNNRLDWLINILSQVSIFDLNCIYNNYVDIINAVTLYVKYVDYIEINKSYNVNSLIVYFYDLLIVILTEKLYIIDRTNYLRYQSRYNIDIDRDSELIEYINNKNYEVIFITINIIEFYSQQVLY